VLLDSTTKGYVLKFSHLCSQIDRLLSDKQIGKFLFPRTHCSRVVFFLYNQYSTCQFQTICHDEFKDKSMNSEDIKKKQMRNRLT